jgi:putative transposase
MSALDRRAKLDRNHPDLSVRQQCAMLGVARSSVYRQPRPVNDSDLEAMGPIDGLFTARPFFGARRIARTLSEEGFPIDRKRVRGLMGVGGLISVKAKLLFARSTAASAERTAAAAVP